MRTTQSKRSRNRSSIGAIDDVLLTTVDVEYLVVAGGGGGGHQQGGGGGGSVLEVQIFS